MARSADEGKASPGLAGFGFCAFCGAGARESGCLAWSAAGPLKGSYWGRALPAGEGVSALGTALGFLTFVGITPGRFTSYLPPEALPNLGSPMLSCLPEKPLASHPSVCPRQVESLPKSRPVSRVSVRSQKPKFQEPTPFRSQSMQH